MVKNQPLNIFTSCGTAQACSTAFYWGHLRRKKKKHREYQNRILERPKGVGGKLDLTAKKCKG